MTKRPENSICPSCGQTVPGGLMECLNCGTAIENSEPEKIAPSLVSKPKEVKATKKKVSTPKRVNEPKSQVVVSLSDSLQVLMDIAHEHEQSGNLQSALDTYHRALAFAEKNQGDDPSTKLVVRTLRLLVQRIEQMLEMQPGTGTSLAKVGGMDQEQRDVLEAEKGSEEVEDLSGQLSLPMTTTTPIVPLIDAPPPLPPLGEVSVPSSPKDQVPTAAAKPTMLPFQPSRKGMPGWGVLLAVLLGLAFVAGGFSLLTTKLRPTPTPPPPGIQIPTAAPGTYLWTMSDATGDGNPSYFDLTGGIAVLDGQTLSVDLYFVDIPATFTIDLSSSWNDYLEDAWFVKMDLDGDGSDELKAGVFQFKFSNETEREVEFADYPIAWGEVVAKQPGLGSSSWEYADPATQTGAHFDPVLNILHLAITSPKLNPQMIMTAQTIQPGSFQYGDDASFVLGARNLAESETGYKFSNLKVTYPSPDTAEFTFDYKLDPTLVLVGDVALGVRIPNCYDSLYFDPFVPDTPTGSAGVELGFQDKKTGTCDSYELEIFVFSFETGADYYNEIFQFPVRIEKYLK